MTKSFRDPLMAPPVTCSAPPYTQRQLGRQAGLHRGHGPERLLEVGPWQRIQRLGVDEIAGPLAAPQLLHLVIEPQREDEAERLHQGTRIRAVQRPSRLSRAQPFYGRAARGACGHPGPPREVNDGGQPAVLDVELAPAFPRVLYNEVPQKPRGRAELQGKPGE